MKAGFNQSANIHQISNTYCRLTPGGTCAGDSGGPLLTSVENLETYEAVSQQIGILHGGLVPCSNVKFPAIYVRLDSPTVHKWLKSEINIPNFWPESIEPGNLWWCIHFYPNSCTVT